MTESDAFDRYASSILESTSVGSRTQIGPLARVLPGATIGEDCNISDHTLIQNDVVLGNRVTLSFGVALWDGITIEDDVFIGANVAFGSHRSAADELPQASPRTVIKRRASIGASSTVYPGVVIGERSIVNAGSVVTRSVPPLAIVAGNPAVIVGYEGTRIEHDEAALSPPLQPSVRTTRVAGVTLHRLPYAGDIRGQLAFAEMGKHIPFEVKRFFVVYGVVSKETRGEHAHRKLHQFLICVHGRCSLMADDGENRQELLLDSPTVGVHLPPLVWGVQYKHTSDAVLLVLASDYYDADDYIRDYSEFLRVLGREPRDDSAK